MSDELIWYSSGWSYTQFQTITRIFHEVTDDRTKVQLNAFNRNFLCLAAWSSGQERAVFVN